MKQSCHSQARQKVPKRDNEILFTAQLYLVLLSVRSAHITERDFISNYISTVGNTFYGIEEAAVVVVLQAVHTTGTELSRAGITYLSLASQAASRFSNATETSATCSWQPANLSLKQTLANLVKETKEHKDVCPHNYPPGQLF